MLFFSRKLSSTELKYSTFDRELLAAFAAIRHFRFVLEGRPFRLLTDHMPLSLAMHHVSAPWSARQVRQLAYISEFTTYLRHVPGKRNMVADTLSRPSAAPPTQAVHTSTVKNMSPPTPAVHTSTVKNMSPPTQAVHTSTVKNTSPPTQAVHTSTVKKSSPPTVVQKSTIKNSDPISGFHCSADPELLVAAMPVSTTVDYAKMAELQGSCTECTQMCNSTVLFVVT